jgi:hypothetical protein
MQMGHSAVRWMRKARLAGIVAGAGFAICFLVAESGQTASLGDEPIVIRSTGREAASIAIPRFTPGRGEVMLKEHVFSEVIYSDLEMTGYFRRGANQQFVEETHRADRQRNEIDFAEWTRLDALFLVIGNYSISGETLTASVYLYYVPTGKRIFG